MVKSVSNGVVPLDGPGSENSKSIVSTLMLALLEHGDGTRLPGLPIKKLVLSCWKLLLVIAVSSDTEASQRSQPAPNSPSSLDAIKNAVRVANGLSPFPFHEPQRMKSTPDQYRRYQEHIATKFPFFFPECPVGSAKTSDVMNNDHESYFDESCQLVPTAFKEGLKMFKECVYDSFAAVQLRREAEHMAALKRAKHHTARHRLFLRTYGQAGKDADDANQTRQPTPLWHVFGLRDASALRSLERIERVYSECHDRLWDVTIFLLKCLLIAAPNVKGGTATLRIVVEPLAPGLGFFGSFSDDDAYEL